MMRLRPLRGLLPLAIVALVGIAGACGGDDDEPTGPVETDLSGDYVMVSVTQAGVTVGPDQGATGTLAVTQTRYTLSATLPGPEGPITTEDTGTYQTDGNTWTQESDNAGGFQGVGTFSLVGATLTIDVTTAGVQVVSVWNLTD
jgi:hypothetical protein